MCLDESRLLQSIIVLGMITTRHASAVDDGDDDDAEHKAYAFSQSNTQLFLTRRSRRIMQFARTNMYNYSNAKETKHTNKTPKTHIQSNIQNHLRSRIINIDIYYAYINKHTLHLYIINHLLYYSKRTQNKRTRHEPIQPNYEKMMKIKHTHKLAHRYETPHTEHINMQYACAGKPQEMHPAISIKRDTKIPSNTTRILKQNRIE